MKLAIADPPYLGRANRWYGDGCGDGNGVGRADFHPEASNWDNPQTHIDLVHMLEKEYDGWAIALTVHSLSTYMKVIETDSFLALLFVTTMEEQFLSGYCLL